MKIIASISIELNIADTELLDEAKDRAIDTLIDKDLISYTLLKK